MKSESVIKYEQLFNLIYTNDIREHTAKLFPNLLKCWKTMWKNRKAEALNAVGSKNSLRKPGVKS